MTQAQTKPRTTAPVGITCPKCRGGDLEVYRTQKRPDKFVRYRRCKSCKYRFCTDEKTRELKPKISTNGTPS